MIFKPRETVIPNSPEAGKGQRSLKPQSKEDYVRSIIIAGQGEKIIKSSGATPSLSEEETEAHRGRLRV